MPNATSVEALDWNNINLFIQSSDNLSIFKSRLTSSSLSDFNFVVFINSFFLLQKLTLSLDFVSFLSPFVYQACPVATEYFSLLTSATDCETGL